MDRAEFTFYIAFCNNMTRNYTDQQWQTKLKHNKIYIRHFTEKITDVFKTLFYTIKINISHFVVKTPFEFAET